MYMALAPSTLLFFYAILFGMIIGACYDIFRIIRVAHTPGKTGILIEDLLFALICTIVTVIFLQCFTDGAFRFFVLIGELMGFILYQLTIGIVIIRIATKIIAIVQKIIAMICKIFWGLSWPFRKVFGWIAKKSHPLFGWIVGKLKKSYKIAKKSLLSPHTLLYNKSNCKSGRNVAIHSKKLRRKHRGKHYAKNEGKKENKNTDF